MGIMSRTCSIYQYEVTGDIARCDLENLPLWIQNCLIMTSWRPPLPGEYESIGWVRIDDHNSADWPDLTAFYFDPYCVFTLRRDVRRVPAGLLKSLVEKECAQWLSERPLLKRVPPARKREIRENIESALLAQALPKPTTVDVVWNTDTGVVTVASISSPVLDFVEHRFAYAFEGLRLVPIHPMRRAERMLSPELRPDLERLNQTGSRDVLLQIKKNRWLGRDFLTWLMYQSAQGMEDYPGDAPGLDFIAYVSDRFVLAQDQMFAASKTTIIGPQRNFSETRGAIQCGKDIAEATLYFERDMFSWKVSLSAETFAFGSFRCPPVKIEMDEITIPAMEREAVFYERMDLLETGLQMFDTVLEHFLRDRIREWPSTYPTITNWIHNHIDYDPEAA